jgi:3-phosphoshikimate 1-carboxyvinyltransferase
VRLPGPARDHTERLLPAFGVVLEVSPLAGGGRQVAVRGGSALSAAAVRVPGDFSAAAFLLAAAAAEPGARVTARGVSLNPTRTGFLDVLREMGAGIEVHEAGAEAAGAEPQGDVTVTGPERLRAFDVPPEWVPRLVDEAPAWAVVASAAHGVSRLRGAAELRVKESDRIAALAAGVRALGAGVEEYDDGFTLEARPLSGGAVDSAGDHRLAMAFAIAATGAAAPTTIAGASAVDVSYPGFFEALARLTRAGDDR